MQSNTLTPRPVWPVAAAEAHADDGEAVPVEGVPGETLIGPRAASLRLRIEPDTLLWAVNEGLVPAYLIGDSIRFRPSELARAAHPSSGILLRLLAHQRQLDSEPVQAEPTPTLTLVQQHQLDPEPALAPAPAYRHEPDSNLAEVVELGR